MPQFDEAIIGMTQDVALLQKEPIAFFDSKTLGLTWFRDPRSLLSNVGGKG